MLIYAIIPARSGSVGLPNKNILPICGHPLFTHAINFAKCLSVARVFVSTDSQAYQDIALKYDAECPFLRSADCATSISMEEDVLLDLRRKFLEHSIPEPDLVVWLRPTFLFRDRTEVNLCIDALSSDTSLSSSRIVSEAESRLYKIRGGRLIPNFDDQGRSMIRRQDLEPKYRVFNTDVFRFRGNCFNSQFLGKDIYPVVSDSWSGLDIDSEIDYAFQKYLIESSLFPKERFGYL